MSELGYPRRGLHGRVVDELGRLIVGGRWTAESPLPNEDELAAEFGVSRTVVRESIKVLQAKGLVEVRPRTGTRVRARRAWHLLDADVVRWQFADMERGEDLRELHEVRSTIEATAARLAAGRHTARPVVRDRGQRAARRGRLGRAGRPPSGRARLPRRGRRGRAEHVAVARQRVDQGGPRSSRLPVGRSTTRTQRRRRHDIAGRRWPRRSAPVTPTASEEAMRALVELDWQRMTGGRDE